MSLGINNMWRFFTVWLVFWQTVGSAAFEYVCDDARPKTCARRERCHNFLTLAATMCEGVDEYRAFCDRASTRADVYTVISSVRIRDCL